MKEFLIQISEYYYLTVQHFNEDYTSITAVGSKIVNNYINATADKLTPITGTVDPQISSNITVVLKDMETKGFMTEFSIKQLFSTILSEYFTKGPLNLFNFQETAGIGMRTYDHLVKYNNGFATLVHTFFIHLKTASTDRISWFDLMKHAKDYLDVENGGKPCFLILGMHTRVAIFEYLPDWHRINGFYDKIPMVNGLLGLFWNEVTSSMEVVPQTDFWFANTKLYDMSKTSELLCVDSIIKNLVQNPYPIPKDANLNQMTLDQVKSHDHWKQWYKDDLMPGQRFAEIFRPAIRTPMQTRLGWRDTVLQ